MPRPFTLEFLQWFGVFGAALTWTGQFVVGYGVTTAACGLNGSRFGLGVVAWEIVLMTIGVALVACSWAAALLTFLSLKGHEHFDPPPAGRRYFFAFATMIGDVLFLVIILLSGIGAIYWAPCQPS